MKAKSDENRMKGKEDERKRATEKHNFFWGELNKKVIKMEDSKKNRRKNENEKKKKKNGETEKRKTLGKTSTMIYFSRIKWCQKKEEIQNLNAKQV